MNLVFYLSIICDDGIEKSVPLDHRLSSLGKPHDAKDDPGDGFFYHTLILMIDSYNLTLGHIRQRSFKQILYQKLGKKGWLLNQYVAAALDG